MEAVSAVGGSLSRSSHFLGKALWLVVPSVYLVFLTVNLFGIHYTGAYAWDDGAITLAYARTLADHGLFALTPLSEIVEGSSSLLFVFLMALLHRIFQFDFHTFITASQWLAFAATCATMVLLNAGLKSRMSNAWHRALVVGLAGLLPTFTAEIFNGMEMSLMAFLMLGFVLAFEAKSRWVFVLVPLLLLTRFEAVFYLSFAVFFLFFLPQQRSVFLAKVAACVVLSFAIISLFRWGYFHDGVPNTIWAKLNPPYSGMDLKGKLRQKIDGAIEFCTVNGVLVFLCALALLAKGKLLTRIDIKVLLVAAIGVFSFIAGKNWGYDGRMSLASLPLLVLILADHAEALVSGTKLMPARWAGRSSAAFDGKAFIFPVLTLALIGMFVAQYPLIKLNHSTVRNGAFRQGLLSGDLEAAARRHLDDIAAWEANRWSGITPSNYRITGLAVDGIRRAAQMDAIKFMAPDVGGLALCCTHLQIIDSALLANRELAKRGYAGFGDYLKRVAPDVIETHGMWSQASGIYAAEVFINDYSPLVFDDNMFWVRNEVLEHLLASTTLQKEQLADIESIAQVRYGFGTAVATPEDRQHLLDRHLPFIWRMSAGE